MIFAFGDFELDVDRHELRRGGEPIPLEKRAFAVLAHLVERRGDLVTKEALLDEVWGDRFVGESAMTTQIKSIRRALGDDAKHPRFVRTVHGKGYRFDGSVTERGTGRSPQLLPASLPRPRTDVIGREQLGSAVTHAIAAHRLVTLVGLGGAGKTRLALEAADGSASEFPDGVYFVDLVPCTDRASVATTIAHQLGLASLDDAAAALRGRRVLCVLDNCEHVVADVADVADELLDGSPTVHLLATSRVPLGLPDEQRVVVDGLELDSGVELLRRRAARFGAAVQIGEAAERIVTRLDGLPLAIELAAAQLRHLTPEALADRLDRRLDLVTAGSRRGPDRHASIEAVLDDTWEMLGEPERATLAQLVVFPGSFEIDDVEAATGQPGSVIALGELVDCSLVQRLPNGRLRVLEMVRLHVADRIDLADARRRHAAWCLDEIGDGYSNHYTSTEFTTWCFDRYDDLWAAYDHCMARDDIEAAARLAAAASMSFHHGNAARAAAALPRLDALIGLLDDPDLIAAMHAAAVACALLARRREQVVRHGRLAVAAAEHADGAAPLALMTGAWAFAYDRVDLAIRFTERAAEMATADGLRPWLDIGAAYRSVFLGFDGQNQAAIATAESVTGATTGDGHGIAVQMARSVLASARVLDEGMPGAWADSLDRPEGSSFVLWDAQVAAAALRAGAGDALETERLVHAVGERYARAGLDPMPDLLLPIIVLSARLGRVDQARRWLRAVHDHRRSLTTFTMTIVLRRLRDAIGLETGVGVSTPMDETSNEAMHWLHDAAADTS